MSDSVWPQRRQPTRLRRPWVSPGKNTGVGCHFLLQCMKVKSKREVTQSCPTLSDPMTAAYQAPPPMGFSRQEYWSGVPMPHGAKSRNGLLHLQLLFKYIYIFESVASFQDSFPSGVTQDVPNLSPNKLCLIVWNVANQGSSLETQYLDLFLLGAYHMGTLAWHVLEFQTPRRNAEGCIIILFVKTVETQWTARISQWWEFSWNTSSQMPMKGQLCQL